MRRTKQMFRWTLPSLLLLFLSFPLPRALAFPPTMVLGLYGSGFWLRPDDPVAGQEVAQEPGITASALLGWRSVLSWGGSLAINGSAALTYAPPGSEGIYDRESVELQLYAPAGGLRLEVETGLSASGLGTLEGLLPYLRPSWSVAGRWLGERVALRPFVEVRGDALLQLSREQPGDEDAVYQGGVLGLAFVPSFQSSYEIAAEAGWQRWLEQVLFDAGGLPTTEPREDTLARLRAGGEWLLGYFATGRISAEGGLRWSNANRMTGDPVVLEDNSESRWFTEVDASLSWSPHRQVGLEAGGFVLGQWYTNRALPAPLTGRVAVLSGGVDLRLDWTPDDRWYLVIDAAALGSYSKDPEEVGWNLRLLAGVELSL